MSHEPFIYTPPETESNIVILCDHATNIVPGWVHNGSLGISEDDMGRHIAYDVGALAVSKILAQMMNAHMVASQFSRLVIDPNRGEDDPTLIMKIYDRTIIEANRSVSPQERETRIVKLHRPYHDKIESVMAGIKENGRSPVIISMHSFTKQLRGRDQRPWHVGILSGDDRRMADEVISAYEAFDGICVGDNEPYHGALEGDTLDQHGIRSGIQHCLIEIRNDLIEETNGQQKWAETTYQALAKTIKKMGI